jgi:hypothetical protein
MSKVMGRRGAKIITYVLQNGRIVSLMCLITNFGERPMVDDGDGRGVFPVPAFKPAEGR